MGRAQHSARIPDFVEPMQAKLVDSIRPGDWIYEIKFDGYRALAILRRTRDMGLGGLIGKRRGSKYEPGRRSGAWIKLKLHQEQEFVIGGYTEPEGGRKYFGCLWASIKTRALSLLAELEPALPKNVCTISTLS
jgi:ATP-dependent DNA ligase